MSAVTIEQANEYFALHLDKSFWATLSDETKGACLNMAEAEIASLWRGAVLISAICEQAVFLARNYAKMNEGKVATSQTLEGLGSQSFTLINAANPGISPRAAAAVEAAKKNLLSQPLKVGRG